MKWINVDRCFEEKLFNVLYSWRGTPYMRGQQLKGVGVDCVRFVCGVLDELQGKPFQSVEDLPADACMENPEGAVKVMLNIMKRYEHDKIEHTGEVFVEPGDIILTGTEKGPGHAMIVGPIQNQLWHCNGRFIEHCPPSFPKKGIERLFRIFRPKGKMTWV